MRKPGEALLFGQKVRHDWGFRACRDDHRCNSARSMCRSSREDQMNGWPPTADPPNSLDAEITKLQIELDTLQSSKFPDEKQISGLKRQILHLQEQAADEFSRNNVDSALDEALDLLDKLDPQ